MNIRISNGRLVDPANRLDDTQDLFISNGRIVAIGRAPRGFAAQRVIDAGGCLVTPGFVDIATHLREPGQEHKGTIASETAAAVASGFTTVCCPPNTQPIIDTPAVVELIHHRAQQANSARVVPLGALTQGLAGKVLSEMAALKGMGCVGVSNAREPVTDTNVLRRAMEYATTLDLTVHIQPRDAWLGRGGCMHESPLSTRLGLPSIPAAAEAMEVARVLMLCEITGTRVHFGRISSGRALSLITEARQRGARVTADTGIAYLLMTADNIGTFDPAYHVQPPFRGEEDRTALRQGHKRGDVDALCSDHQPHNRDAKAAPFESTEPGISMLDTFVPMLLKVAGRGNAGLHRAVASVTYVPAQILGLDAGQLALGGNADLTIIDPAQQWRCDAAAMRSHGRNSPWLDQELTGRAIVTLVGGRVVHDISKNGKRSK